MWIINKLMYMCLSLLHQGADRMQEEEEEINREEGSNREIRERKRGLEKGSRGKEGRGARKKKTHGSI